MRIIGSLISFMLLLAFADCSCKLKKRNGTTDNNLSRSFSILSGAALDAAVTDKISRQDTNQISLKELGISKFTKNMLKKFDKILSLDLSFNEISEIENEAFSGSTKLEKINLDANHLEKISKKTFKGDFKDLQEIYLSNNLISLIEVEAFDKITQLEVIDLSKNCLTYLHSELFKRNPELREVFLNDNEIIEIDSDVFNPKTDLKYFDLAKNHLDFVPELEMKKIKHFELSFNQISQLNLSSNSLERKKSASIHELILAHNLIRECPESDDEMRSDIMHLDLSHNKLENLNEFPSFLNLEVLVLAHNNITDLSLHIFEERFPSLKVLNIRENPIDCSEYRYVRNNLQGLVVSVDSALTHRCHHHQHSNDTAMSDSIEYDEYEEAIIGEIRKTTREVIKQLKVNRTLIIILLSTLFLIAIATITFCIRHQFELKQQFKENLVNQIEL